jgi:hypothetical protein
MKRAKHGHVARRAKRQQSLTCVNAAAAGAPYRCLHGHRPLSLARSACRTTLQGLATGTLFAAFGVFLMQHAGLVPGGTVGIALLLHYATAWTSARRCSWSTCPSTCWPGCAWAGLHACAPASP